MLAATGLTVSLRLMNLCPKSPAPTFFQRAGEKTPVFVRFSTVAGNKGSADLARDVRGFAVKFYTKEGNWDLVGNSIPVFLHSGCDQVPRLRPRSKAGAGPRLPAGANGPRQFLGFHFTDAGIDEHGAVDHVRPDDPALFPLHAGLRRAHLPARQCRREIDFRQIPLEPKLGLQSVVWNEALKINGADPDFPPPRPLGRNPEWRLSGVGARAATLRRGFR